MKIQKLAQSYYIRRIRTLGLLSKKRAANLAFKVFCTPFNKTVYKPTPFIRKANELTLNLEGLVLKGYQWNKGAGRRILIVHGFRSASVNFVHVVRALISRNCEVIAFDAPGHGRSKGNTITVIQYRDMIRMILEKLGPVDGILGHSLGCMATAFAVAEWPENKKISLVFLAAAADLSELTSMFFRQMKISDKQVRNYFMEKIAHLTKNPIEWFTIKRCLLSIKGQVLWIHDLKDRVTPVKDAMEAKELDLPNLQVIFTTGLGHRDIYRDERVVAQAVDFLARSPE
jgi:pimeloyl-ACP methyl ester carboxylesterase